MSSKSSKRSSRSFISQLLFPFVVIIPVIAIIPLLIGITFTIRNDEPLKHAIPYATLFTGFRPLTLWAWKKFGTPIDLHAKYSDEPIPEIDFKDYTFEKLREITNNFQAPAVVRGMFNDVPAIEKWKQQGYLKSKIGHFEIPVILNAQYGTPQTNRTNSLFAHAIDDVMGEDHNSSYLFFPMKNRPSKNHYGSGNQEYHVLTKAVNNLVLEDLLVDQKIWNGFGTERHQNYIGGQLIIGNGKSDITKTTGTGWHCALGSNFFVQIVGRKRWYFIHPKYTKYIQPARLGMVAFMISYKDYGFQYYPHRYTDLEPGDMLYNPDYQWHTIKNYDGLSIGVPIREVNITYSFRNNLLFTSVAIYNKVLEHFGIDIGGFPESKDAEKLNHD